jgi:transcriptional regulator with XRE-family HTH domain
MTAREDVRVGPSPDWEFALGRSLRQLRHEKGLTLTEFGALTGFSPSFLSQLERGLTSVSLQSLSVLAEGLDTSGASLLAGAQQGASETVSFMSGRDAPGLDSHDGYGRVLVRGHRPIQPLLLVGGPQEFDDAYVVHAGDEFIHVIEGGVQYELVGEGVYDLGPGDSLYYRGGIKHRWRQLGAKQCRLLAVLADR